MWAILQVGYAVVVLFLAIAAVRLAGALLAVCLCEPQDEPRPRGWRRRFLWILLLVIAASLVDMQFGGFYFFTDPRGVDWRFDGHGWPLVHQYSLLATSELHRISDVAIYLAALAVNCLSLLALLAATQFVVDRWLLAGAGAPRSWRAIASSAAGWIAALAAIVWFERFLAEPVTVPGTAIMFYTPLIYQAWYIRWPTVLGLACTLFVVGWWAACGVKALARLREEGVI